jgi:hypothetical protein
VIPADDPAPGTSRGQSIPVILDLWPLPVGLATGGWAGYQAFVTASRGGLEGIGAAFILLGLGLAVILLVIIGAVLIATRAARRVGRWSLLLAAGMVGGGVIGSWSVSAFDRGYEAPIVQTVSGAVRLRLDAAPSFGPNDDGPATCRSAPDGRAVEQVTALDLGELENGTLRAFIWPPPGQADGIGRVELFPDGADVPAGAVLPAWSGPGTFEVDATGQRGSSTFVATLGGPPAPAWPATLAGTVTWACDDWPVAAGPSSAGQVAAVGLALDAASTPGVTASPRPPTCAERYPADGPGGVDLQLGCVVNEVVGSYLGLGGAGGSDPPRLSGYLMPILLLAAAVVVVGGAGRVVVVRRLPLAQRRGPRDVLPLRPAVRERHAGAAHGWRGTRPAVVRAQV